jgi:hypothetical protein
MTTIDHKKDFSSSGFGWVTIAVFSIVSLVYFAGAFLKASRKCFWFDELFSVYLCRLPTFNATWTAVTHGADFNPPLFYLLTRGSQRLFGEGLVATRLPAIVGVWLFGVCLFLFVARRTNLISGFIAGTFPLFTLVQYYAYEARAHGLVLGWCGLTLVCWQRVEEGDSKHLWLAGFGLSLLGALLTHVYAVYILFPFALVELYNLHTRRRPNWGIIAAMALPSISVIVTVYLPLFRAFKTSIPSAFFLASHDSFQRFLVHVIGPSVGVILLSLVLFTLGAVRPAQHSIPLASIPPREMVVAVGFACIPLVGSIGCEVSHGPFVDRYFLSSIAGYAIFLGFASSRRLVASWSAKALAGCMFLFLLADVGTTAYLSIKHRLILIEPGSGLFLSTTPKNPLAIYESLSTENSNLDILVLPHLEYIYLFTYAPSSVVSRLYFGATADDLYRKGYERLAREAHLNLKTTIFDQFLAIHNKFLVYGRADGEDMEGVQILAKAGYKMKSARADAEGVMYEYER